MKDARQLMATRGTIKRIHVDRHAVAHNRKSLLAGGAFPMRNRTLRPPITVQTSQGSVKLTEMTIDGMSHMVYRPFRPLPCGATVWIETHAVVREGG